MVCEQTSLVDRRVNVASFDDARVWPGGLAYATESPVRQGTDTGRLRALPRCHHHVRCRDLVSWQIERDVDSLGRTRRAGGPFWSVSEDGDVSVHGTETTRTRHERDEATKRGKEAVRVSDYYAQESSGMLRRYRIVRSRPSRGRIGSTSSDVQDTSVEPLRLYLV